MLTSFSTVTTVLVLSTAIAGCKSYTSCGIGTQMCSTDQKQAQKCVGPDEGGDADGEIKVIEDCGASGKICSEDANTMTEPMSIEVGCVPSACAHVWPCFHSGETRCDLEYDYLMVCETGGECPSWNTIQVCTANGGKCAAAAGGARCTQ